MDKIRRQKLVKYERNGDTKVLQNTIYTTSKTHIFYGTVDQAEYNRLKGVVQYKLIATTYLVTMEFAQIHGLKERNHEG